MRALFAAIALERVGLIELLLPGPVVIIAMWVVFGYLVIVLAALALIMALA